MSEKEVDIRINTKADLSGAKKAADSADRLGKELNQAAREGQQTAQKSRDLTRSVDLSGRSIQQLEDYLQELNAEMRKVGPNSDAFQKLNANIGKTQQRLGELSTTAAKYQSANGKATKSTRNMGMATLEMSRAFEDAQYGMRGVLNNIPGLITMLGGTAGLAGVVSIAAVSISMLYQQIEKLKKKAKEAEAGAADMADELKSFIEEVDGRKLDSFLGELDRMNQLQSIINDGSRSALEVEALRRQSLERISEKLKEQAKLEIELQQARGDISPEQAQTQIRAIDAEAESAIAEAKIALLNDKVQISQQNLEQHQQEIQALADEKEFIRREIDRVQAEAFQAVNQRAILLQKEENLKAKGVKKGLGVQDQVALDNLNATVAGFDKQIKGMTDRLDSIPEEIANAETETAAFIQELERAIQERSIGTEEIDKVAQIAVSSAELALTAAAENTLAGIEEIARETTRRGQQMDQAARRAMSDLSAALTDGMVKADEVDQVTQAIERLRSTREGADQRVAGNFDSLTRAAEQLAIKASLQKSRIDALERKVESIK